MAWLLNAVNSFLAQGAGAPPPQQGTPPPAGITKPGTPPFFAKMTAPDTTAQPPAAAPAQAVAPDTMAKPPAQSPDLPKLPEAQQTTEGKPQPPAATPPAQPNQPTAAGSPPLTEDEYFKAHPEAIPARPAPSGLAARPPWQQEAARAGMGVLSGIMNLGTRPGVDPRRNPGNAGTNFLNQWQANQQKASDAASEYDKNLPAARQAAYQAYLKNQGDIAGIGEKGAATAKDTAEARKANFEVDNPKGEKLTPQEQAMQARIKGGMDPIQAYRETLKDAQEQKPEKDVSTKEDLQNRIAQAQEKGDMATVGKLQKEMLAIDPEGATRIQDLEASRREHDANAAQARLDKETNKMGYAMNQDTGKLEYMSKADADKQHSTFEEMKTGDVKADRQLTRQLDDVQQNLSRYRNATNAMKKDIPADHASMMQQILSDDKLGVKLDAFGVGINTGMLNDIITGTSKGAAWNKLSPEERDLMTGYFRAKSSVIAYNKALTNSSRAAEKQMAIEMAQIPEPNVGSSVANPRLEAWQENIDRASDGLPTNLPGIKHPTQVRSEVEDKQGGGVTVQAGGKTYQFKDQTSADAFKKEAGIQ